MVTPQMADPEPPVSSRLGAHEVEVEKNTRTPLVMALLLGGVLVAAGLYLWRRPKGPDESAFSALSDAGFAVEDVARTEATADAARPESASGLVFAELRVVGCQDKGPKRTPASECDRLPAVEKALLGAIEQTAQCVPAQVGGGSMEYVADVSFRKKRVGILLPKEGRSIRHAKTVRACGKAVKEAINASLSFDGLEHAHARYKIAVGVTYPARKP